MSNPIVLGYWNILGLASPIRYLLELANVPYKEETYDLVNDKTDEWFEKKYNLGLKLPNLPYIIDGDVRMTEYIPIMRYLARKHGLGPKNEQETILSDQVESFVIDVKHQFYRAAYNTESYEKAKTEFNEYARKKLPDLNKLYANSDYLLGSRLTYVDVLIYDFMLILNVFNASLVNENPNLSRLVDTIEKLPNMVAYKKSNRFVKGLFCAPVASFKGAL